MMPGASGMPTTVINNTFNPTGPTGTGSFNPTGKFVGRINEDCDVRRERLVGTIGMPDAAFGEARKIVDNKVEGPTK